MRSCLLFLLAFPVWAGSVEGTVTDSVTRQPIKRATVTLASPSLHTRYIAGCDDQGRFQFPDVQPAADYIAEAQARGYIIPAPSRQTAKERPPIAVAKDEVVKAIAVKMVPLGAINGRITDADGEPVRRVAIQALQYQYRGSGRRLDIKAGAVTDANGRYRLYFLQPGKYLVRAYLHETPPGPAEPDPHVHNFVPADGFPPAYYPGSPDAAQAAVVEVKPGADLTGYDLRMARVSAYHLRGQVEGAETQTTVVLAPCATPAMDLASVVSFQTRPNGTFDARGITPGQYCVAVSRPGGRLTIAQAQVTVKDADVNVRLAATVRVALQGTVQMDPAQTERPAKLSVLVADLDTPGLLLGVGRVQDDGSFSMPNVQAGPASLQINGQPEDHYLKSFHFAGYDSTGPFEVPRSRSTLTLVIGAGAGQVTGKVQDQDGKPGDHMLVTLAPKGALASRTDLIQTKPTTGDGSFQFTGVAPGDYNLYAWDSLDYDAAHAPAFFRMFESNAGTVSVQASNAATAQLKAVTAEEMEAATWKPQQ